MSFDNVGDWSVSADMGRPSCVEGADDNGRWFANFFLQGCRFANLSTQQARVIDVELKIPTTLAQRPILTLSTLNTHEQSHRRALSDHGIVVTGRTVRFLDYPIIIPPGSVVEGQMELSVSRDSVLQEHGFWKNLEMTKAEFIIRDQRSGLSKRFPLGACYDARKGRFYKGRIGLPALVWRPRWLKFRRWLALIVKRAWNG